MKKKKSRAMMIGTLRGCPARFHARGSALVPATRIPESHNFGASASERRGNTFEALTDSDLAQVKSRMAQAKAIIWP